ncbi:hypothetical protein [Actinophytocola oryzae]|uniref:Uncharacterized protein n=1 Tax=Actinophytocola oryzae TaxID=502181 RepID=A0A4R7VUY9_9PSEU|nr:hypothetical protein [Actinophytocola oryzae]TDV53806.1 hypothetical protein CLV71_104274 [Actinophytocola oryzae]
MTHELTRSQVLAIAEQQDRRFHVEAQITVVVHDLEALRTAARRAFDHGRFTSEKERTRAWEAIENDPASLIGQTLDFARLTEDVPGLLPHSAEWTVSKDA